MILLFREIINLGKILKKDYINQNLKHYLEKQPGLAISPFGSMDVAYIGLFQVNQTQ